MPFLTGLRCREALLVQSNIVNVFELDLPSSSILKHSWNVSTGHLMHVKSNYGFLAKPVVSLLASAFLFCTPGYLL